jgi:hypothetical protein
MDLASQQTLAMETAWESSRWDLGLRLSLGPVASALALFLFLFVGGMCGRFEFPAISSKDGSFAARVSEEDYGAVDSFHSSVQLWQNRHGISARLFGDYLKDERDQRPDHSRRATADATSGAAPTPTG